MTESREVRFPIRFLPILHRRFASAAPHLISFCLNPNITPSWENRMKIAPNNITCTTLFHGGDAVDGSVCARGAATG